MICNCSTLTTALDLPGLAWQDHNAATTAASDFEGINFVEDAPAHSWLTQNFDPISRSHKGLPTSFRAHCSTEHGDTTVGWWRHCQKFDQPIAQGGLTFPENDPRNEELLGHNDLAQTLGPRSGTTDVMAGGKRQGMCVRAPESLHPRVGMANVVDGNDRTDSNAIVSPSIYMVGRGYVLEMLADLLMASGSVTTAPGWESRPCSRLLESISCRKPYRRLSSRPDHARAESSDRGTRAPSFDSQGRRLSDEGL